MKYLWSNVENNWGGQSGWIAEGEGRFVHLPQQEVSQQALFAPSSVHTSYWTDGNVSARFLTQTRGLAYCRDVYTVTCRMN